MDAIFQFFAFGVWSIICFAIGIAAGYLVRYCMEDKDGTPICYGKMYKTAMTGKGCKPKSNAPPGGQGTKGGHGRATGKGSDYPDGSDSDQDHGTSDHRHELDSNLGFDVVSEPPDTSAPAPPVPETIMPPPQPHPDNFDFRRRDSARNGWMDRRPNVPMYFTDTEGTRVHTRADCRGLQNRKKDLQMKQTCSWCCGGVMVVP